ncbi:MAG: aminomethyl-transferring glycine dehydrogenase subunit GcvPA [Polyangiaceae bacterium]|nr:aminomethyl-transferring glycine dehydrogenase subunit GcvPA [Polyangiaceae bacterium]
MMRYLPHTTDEVEEMLAAAGKGNIDELFDSVPSAVKFQGELAVDPALGEAQLMKHLSALSKKNQGAEQLSFLGAGMYAHHIPPAVDQLLLRSEFYTAYTPYQPEVAQGTLLAIWEFQTMVSELYGLPLANASLYDGASATAEAALMARRLTRRPKVVMSGCVHPEYRETAKTYLRGVEGAEIEVFDALKNGTASLDKLRASLDKDVACIVIGYPSWKGPLSDLRELAHECHENGSLLVVSVVEPYALALAESPGALGADIVAGEGQPLACSPQFGGPGVGLLACRHERKYLQQLPGRVAGETVDKKGKRGWVLTLSTREQHIRRERATSNICTNQGLIALAFAIRVSLLGKQGFIEAAEHCLAKAEYLKAALAKIPGISLPATDVVTFNEFVIQFDEGASVLERLLKDLEAQNILAGFPLGRYEPENSNQLLIAVTECHDREELDHFIKSISTALSN